MNERPNQINVLEFSVDRASLTNALVRPAFLFGATVKQVRTETCSHCATFQVLLR